VDPNSSFYSDVDGVLFNQGQTTLVQYPPGLAGTYGIPGSVTSIGDYAFEGCGGLTSVTIPGSVTNIGLQAFSDCLSLTNATIANGVTSIGDYAFESCTSLTSVTIPRSVTSIGLGPFEFCRSLTSVTIPGNVTSIGNYAFYGCGLTNVTIPDGVISIGAYAFAECNLLNSIITIPSSVTWIGSRAFYLFAGLPGAVYFKGNLPSLGVYLFDYYNHLPPFYYLPGATGFLEGVLWNPLIQVGDGGFGVQNNQFGFNIAGTNNFTVVVAACTNLASPVWVPLSTNTLVNGSCYFSDPQWTNYPARFYSLQMP
jgi:hypothetical protein